MTEVSTDLGVIAWHLALAGLFVLLIGFPAELFNKTLEENYDEVRGWFRRGRSRAAKSQVIPPAARLLFFAAVAALLYGFLDPQIGTNGASLTLVAGLFLSIVVSTLAFELPIGLFTKRVCGRACTLRTFPGAMAVAAGCVAVSRVANFRPGYVYGIFAGYAVLDHHRLSKSEDGRSVALGSLVLLAVSLTAWLAWTPVDHSAEGSAGAWILIADALLAGVFVAGMESLAFGLAPLRFLEGYKLARWDRRVWALLQFIAAFGFLHVLLDPRTERVDSSSRASLASVVLLFVGFGLASITFWAYFRFRPRRPAPRPPRSIGLSDFDLPRPTHHLERSR